MQVINVGVDRDGGSEHAPGRFKDAMQSALGGADVDNAHAMMQLVAFAVRHNQGHIVVVFHQGPALLEKNPDVVARVRRSEVGDPGHGCLRD